MRILYYTVTNTSGIKNVSVTSNHDSPVATAIIEARTTTLTLGDLVTVDLGYSDDHSQVFIGYVKIIEKKVPDNTYVITAYDLLARAQDYFIASTNPESAREYRNISAEALVQDLMSIAGLTSFTYDTTYFTFGINNAFEVNLVSSYDYSRTIADLLTWVIWLDSAGTVHFENRKPYVMINQFPENAQPGWAADVSTGTIITTVDDAIDFTYTYSERNLRNRVVVYGSTGVYAEASEESSLLPAGFYKTSVLAFPQLVGSQALAQSIADYNLDLQNRITYSLAINAIGDPDLRARTVITLDTPYAELDGDWYIFGCDHGISSDGFITTLELRRMLKVA